MARLISAKEAQKIVAGSAERKNYLIEQLNKEISSQAQKGLRWVHFPSDTNSVEKDWIRDELAIQGYTVKNGEQSASW